MNRRSARLSLVVLTLSTTDAFAHHVMGGRMPATFTEGILSGLGHPIIGLDHLAGLWRWAASRPFTPQRLPS